MGREGRQGCGEGEGRVRWVYVCMYVCWVMLGYLYVENLKGRLVGLESGGREVGRRSWELGRGEVYLSHVGEWSGVGWLCGLAR